MHAGLVGEVRDVTLSVSPRISDDRAVPERDPCVGRKRGLVHPPPLAKLLAREPDRVVLPEVHAVPGGEQRGDGAGVIQDRSAYDDILDHNEPAYFRPTRG